jgi:L-ascorbate metabolism protein UlaG (beta-lactamase superfamily)
MTRPIVALLASLLVVCPAWAAKARKKAKYVSITWHGQSFFEIESSNGFKIVTDPHAIPAYDRVKGVKANLILASHRHSDHVQFQVVENFKEQMGKWKKAKLIEGLKAMGLREDWVKVNETFKKGKEKIRVRSVPAYHDNVNGMKRGKNTIFVITMDGINLCFLGDLGQEKLTREQLKEIGPVDVLFIPVGGVYTINGDEAKGIVKQIKPKKYVIPMHYGTRVFEDLLPIKEFLEDHKGVTIVRSSDNSITFNVKYKPKKPILAVLNFEPAPKKKRRKKEDE